MTIKYDMRALPFAPPDSRLDCDDELSSPLLKPRLFVHVYRLSHTEPTPWITLSPAMSKKEPVP